jgi:hypothetical protein
MKGFFQDQRDDRDVGKDARVIVGGERGEQLTFGC